MPRTTATNDKFYYVYVLESIKDGKRYVGYTNNLRRRLKEHNNGKNFSTKPRLPFRLIYYEACLNEEDAQRREKFFKQTKGRESVTKRLRKYYEYKKSL